MRWIFLSLLAINVMLFAYVQWQQHQRPVKLEKVEEVQSSQNVATLVLLSELKSKSKAKKAIETVRINSAGEGVQPQANDSGSYSRALCTLVGSFADIASADLFVEKLAVFDVQSKVKNLLVSTTVGYWLHLPPFDSRKSLIRRLGELQRQGIDSYIIPDGDLENGISLGMFSEAARAQTLKDKVSSLGYEAAILEVPREKREIWVFIIQDESSKISEEQWSGLISGKDLLQKQQNLCSDVAST